MNSKTISEKVIYYRKLKGYSQEKLSHETSVTIRTIQRIEKGEVNPHLQTVKLLAVGLGVDVDDLIALENPKEESLQLKWLLLMHSTPLIGFVLPLFNILLPLFLWIHKREDNQIYNIHGRKIINFQITMTLLYVLALIALVTIEGYGFFFFILVIPYAVIVMIVNIITTLQSQKSYYPLSIPFLRAKKSSKLAMLLLTILICSCNNPKDNIERLDGTIISKDSLTSKINQLVKDANVHGASISIFNNNKVTYSKTFGYKDFLLKEELTDSTNLYGASFSKAVFGVLVMKLVEDGLIDLDTPLETYLPKKYMNINLY